MADPVIKDPDSELTDDDMRYNAIQLAFDGDEKRFEEFCRVLEDGMPPETGAVLGGSSVMGHSFEGDPYDADGPRSSDLDIYLIGNEAMKLFSLDGMQLPVIHTHPVKDGDEEIAPDLKPLRHKLKEIARREVTLQASQNFYYWFREKILGQPYLLIAGTLNKDENA